MNRLAQELGLALPQDPSLRLTSVAAAIGILCWLAAIFAGRKAGPRLAALWEKHAGARSEGIGERMCHLIRDLAAAILLAITQMTYSWPLYAGIILGLMLATAVALLIVEIVRGLHMARWAAGLLGSVAFVAVLAESVGGLTPVTNVLHRVGFTIGTSRFSLLTVLQIVITLLALFAVVKLANRIVNQSIKRTTGLDATQRLLAQKLAGVVIIIIAFFVGIDLIGIDLTALAVFSGALGLAVGFGLQKTVGNLFAGIILLMDRSIKPGDVIAVGDSFGSVNKIGVRAVSIVTREGKEYLIPNEILMTEEVVNWSYSTRDLRISIPVGIAYDSDVALAQKLMIEAASSAQRVLRSPKPNVWMTGFGDSALDHEIRLWIHDPEAGIGSVRSEILNRLYVLFKENGIEIPFPQRDVHVKEWPRKDEPPPAS